jgi:hypothetical protein
MAITRALAMSMLGTKYLIERDMLSNCVSRISGGFCPPTVLNEARFHSRRIQSLITYLEEISSKKKDEVVATDWWDLEKRIKAESSK